MNATWKRLLIWAPRVLALLFAGFISLFALDVFDAGYTAWETAVALFMHLIPTWLILIALALGWKWAWAGAAGFWGLGLFYIVISRGDMHWSAYLVIVGPAVLVGALFLVDWIYRDRLYAAT